MTDLDCSNKGLIDLKGIGVFKYLIYLFCENNQITSLKPIEQLKKNGIYKFRYNR